MSTIASSGLDFCVRNENRYDPTDKPPGKNVQFLEHLQLNKWEQVLKIAPTLFGWADPKIGRGGDHEPSYGVFPQKGKYA